MPEYGGLGDRIKELESQVAKLNRARRLESASIGSGGITVRDGGQISFLDTSGNTLFTIDENGLITFEADGSQLSVLDGTRLRFNRADGTRSLEVTPAGGMKIYAANGTTEQVVLDSDGLQVAGGLVQAVWFNAQDALLDSQTINTTSTTDRQTITIDPPAWVEGLSIMAATTMQFSDTSDNLGFTNTVIDDGGAEEEARVVSVGVGGTGEVSTNAAVSLFLKTMPLSPAGRTVSIVQRAWVNTGSVTANLRVSVLAVGYRSSFA
jgi:hypothetical protein